MESWGWLHKHDKTPVELGLDSWSEVDPWWHDAVSRVGTGYGKARDADLNG